MNSGYHGKKRPSEKRLLNTWCSTLPFTGVPWSEPDPRERMSEEFPVRYAVTRMCTTGRKRTRMSAETVTIRGIPSDTVIFKKARYDDINAFERHLVQNGTLLLKFFLNIWQKGAERTSPGTCVEDKEKYWKFSLSDPAESRFRDDCQQAYEQV